MAKASTVFASEFGAKGSTDGKLNNPTGIAIDSSRNLWVGDAWDDRVSKWIR